MARLLSPSRRALCAALLLAAAGGCASAPGVDPIDGPLDAAVQSAVDLPQTAAKASVPSNDRIWEPNQARNPTAEFVGNQVTIRNIRDTAYRSVEDYTVRYFDKTYDLDRLKTVDFVVVPFPDMPSLAHTMLSFGFDDEDYLVVSVETRREAHESYDPVAGFLNQYELLYVVGTERDLIQMRTHHWMNGVYLYPTRAAPEQVRALFSDVMHRVNQLAVRPEFYNTLSNNCTTNIRRHINQLHPNRIPYDYRVLLPGHSDRLAYDLGLLDTDQSFAQTREQARINYLAYLHDDDPDFSVKIRQNVRTARR